MPRPRSDIPSRIVAAARARFLAEGVDGASLREIAREARTNIGMVVYYFPTKDDLFLAVVEEVYALLVREMEQLLTTGGTARQRLRRVFVRLGRASDLEMDVIRLIAREALSSSTRLRRILARFMRGHVPLVVETIALGLQTGEFDPALPAPAILLAVIGIGALPQAIRRAARSLAPFSGLPDVEGLADLSIGLLERAVGRPDRPLPADAARPKKRSPPRRDARRRP